MKRYGLLYKVKRESLKDYEKAHAEIWPEMNKVITETGFRNYSIFATEDGMMFAYLEHENLEEGLANLYRTEISKRWQEYMENFFEKQISNEKGPEYIYLKEVYHLD